jgi:hypothetical protein
MIASFRRLAGSAAYRSALYVCLALVAAATVRADDWKVETRIYEGMARKPVAITTTYYRSGVYCDVLGNPPQVTLLDPAAEQITLLDMGRRWRTEIKTADLAKLAGRFDASAAKNSNAAVRFAATSKFVPEFDRNKQELVLNGKPLSYRVHTSQPPNAEAAGEYRQFSDWCARLNSVHLGRLPAPPRLAINDELASRGLVPTAVWLTTRATEQGDATTLRSEHEFTWELSATDQQQVEAVKAMTTECEAVSFAKYLGYDASRKQAASDATK